MTCMMDGAALVSVNTLVEHQFVSQWLMANDPAINTWYTSGFIDEETLKMKWEGDGMDIEPGLQYWLNNDHKDKSGDHIVYTYGVYEYLWSREYSLISLPYICEISQTEAYKIVKEDRDFDFGSNYSDPLFAPKGPKFVLHQQSVIVVRTDSTLNAAIEYIATGLPQPNYKIIQTDDEGNVTDMSTLVDSRYTITNGKLSIQSPNEALDSGTYHCTAQNEFGLVVSNPMQLSFGFLSEFSNVEPSPVDAYNDDRAAIDCTPPNYRPAVNFQWYKGNYHFIRPDLHAYMFISRNGKLYFSVVSTNDAGAYRCIVKLSSNNGAAIGTNQPPSRISLPIQLRIINAAASVWGPEIANDFPAVFPNTPKRGQNVHLECLAYGSMPLSYFWTRNGLPMPPDAYMEDHNRVLVIPIAKVEDSGNYTCHVTRQNVLGDFKHFYLSIEAEPFFLFPLKDQHIDQGSQLTWHCAARGIPAPTYFWLKNGVRLYTIEGDITISNNVLVVHNADPVRHNGMYQCGAENKHGISHTEGQLRVLGFKPTFIKRPVEEVVYGALGGNASFACQPEAAPFPSFKWLKNGAEINLVPGDTSSRIMMLTNGNLLITEVNTLDAGYYTCVVENSFGIANNAGQLVITSRTVISVRPQPVTASLNETAFIRCQATVDPNIDLVYSWKFNGHQIDVENDIYFTLGTSSMLSGLFIRMAQHKHAGYYECVAKTPMDTDIAGTTLTVIGPPGEIAYVYVETGTITATSARLGWVLGYRYQNPVMYYTVENANEPYTNWTVLIPNLPEADVIIPIEDNSKRIYQLSGLNPGVPYKFRVRAANAFGIGPIGRPSIIYQTLMAPPPKAPDNVGGGGGMVADLKISWDTLPPLHQGGPGIGYHVYWRMKGGDTWSKGQVNANEGVFVTQIGVNNYYLQFEVKVQPFNNLGAGPNSTISTIYSAEDLPIVTVTGINAYRYNATAILVTWDSIDNTREVMKGEIMGYQVNYWERSDPDPIVNSISWRTLDTFGLCIGLLPNTWYEYDVQVFNTAGLNSRGEVYFQRTTLNAPLAYPTEVAVTSHGSDSVAVSWRGILTGPEEESLNGYIVRYWLQGDDITQAKELKTDMETHAVIYGIGKGELYQLRLAARNRGGDGNFGNTVHFTLGGQVVIDPTLSEIRAGVNGLVPSLICIHITCLLSCTFHIFGYF
ncbi:contactin-like [Mytilus edulis]|uniref:contactin-like n=1 Tax=Mytilus edulis TaxID=6550 RepID=UPI0039F040EA